MWIRMESRGLHGMWCLGFASSYFQAAFHMRLKQQHNKQFGIAAKVHMQFATHNKPIAIFYSQIRYKIKNFKQILDILKRWISNHNS